MRAAVGVLILTVFFQKNALSAGFVFNRALKMGLSGEDVRALQAFLNREADTRVQDAGPGSPGQETIYFGALTRSAVIRFQEKYRSDILTPNGLSNGTGYVGPSTILKLNSIAEITQTNPIVSQNIPQSIVTSVTQNVTPNIVVKSIQGPSAQGILTKEQAFNVLPLDGIVIFGLSHEKVKSGDTLIVYGYGFNENSVIHIGPAISIMVLPTPGTRMSILVPNMTFGTYPIWVTNSRGASNADISVTVGDVTDMPPVIMSVSPPVARSGDAITIVADKLDLVGNTIYSTLGIIRNVPSADGHTMYIKADDFPNAQLFFKNKSVDQFTVSFSVKTSAGRSVDFGTFVIHI